MKTYHVTIKGLTPLMHHKMTDEELMALLTKSRATKKKDKEVLTPREIAQKHAYQAIDGTYYIPTTYICGAFIQASSDYKQSNTSRKSMKSIAGGVFRPTSEVATLTDPETLAPIKNFEVDIKKATNHRVGAVAVCRPRFDRWYSTFSVAIDDSIISPEIAHQILEDAGRRVGIGSFRISKGGYYGGFEVTEWKELVETN